MKYDAESIETLTELGKAIEALVQDKHYDAAASFWPQSMTIEEVIHFALNCANHGSPLEDENDE